MQVANAKNYNLLLGIHLLLWLSGAGFCCSFLMTSSEEEKIETINFWECAGRRLRTELFS